MGEKPLIQYPIDLALASKKFESVWINTESEELGRCIEKLGAEFHKRPAELASDTATNRDYTYEFMQKHVCDYVIMINPTSSLLRQETGGLMFFCGNGASATMAEHMSHDWFQNAQVNTYAVSETVPAV